MSVVNKVKESGQVLNAILVLGFLGIVWLMIYGNLSGNLGFVANSQGYNDTQGVIMNMTRGTSTFFGFSNTFFTITAIVLLITILLGLLYVVMGIMKGFGGSKTSGYS
jgi:vacuolar-type H+-ATPase subunit I/STV1